eukprot:CAMPEP_0116871026 /NCGR_PEP_ID=MMETSP0463-20121206/1201_1 /TAXON_ID=181622 /ORGANISM="Strombidinopsis sp, Strain SopsisLIS2011" /LENGTH=138 /DNA_ID=CAMNT_0004508685 /DNA_START=826 /DNA_END=1239 /DNA_ORIENTATION=-
MDLNQGDEESSDNEEKAFIKSKQLDILFSDRQIIEIDGAKMPYTITVLGCNDEFHLGCRVTVFNRDTCSDEGFFLVINDRHWLLKGTDPKINREKSSKPSFLVDKFALKSYLKFRGTDGLRKKMVIENGRILWDNGYY